MGNYSFTGSAQYVIVGATGIYDIVAFGARGGDYGNSGSGANGAEIGGNVALTQGEKLKIIVGGAGQGDQGGAGGGGGGSFVLANTGPGGAYVPLVIVGGGGGGGPRYRNGGEGLTTTAGGAGGLSQFGAGAGGVNGNGGVNGGVYGGGGSGVNSAGGNYFSGGKNSTGGYAGGAGHFSGGSGGFGGGGGGGFYGGGGGGGYSGGGGGSHGGGGGGGSLDNGVAIAAQTIAGENAGNGSVVITLRAATSTPMAAGAGGAGGSVEVYRGAEGGAGGDTQGALGGIGATNAASGYGGGGGGGAAAGMGGAGGNSGGAGGRAGTVTDPNGGNGGVGASGSFSGGGGGGGGFSTHEGSFRTTDLTGGNGGNGGYGGNAGGGGGGGGGGGTGAIVYGPNPGTNSVVVTGGNGGAGGGGYSSANGGSGGAGGGGVLLTGSGATVTNSATITGGNGGAGGYASQGEAGSGGAGGAGLTASSTTIVNTASATIAGGSGGRGGNLSFGRAGAGGVGGAGIIGSTLAITNDGTITAGEGGAGTVASGAAGDAIEFTGGANTLTLGTVSAINGAISLDTSTTTLTFAQSGYATLTSAVIGAGSVSKTGFGTLVLTNNNTYTGTTTINAGTLQLGNGGTQSTISGTSSVVDNGLLSFDTSDAEVFAAPISGTGHVVQYGSGTTTLVGANTYSGGTQIDGGTIDLATAAVFNGTTLISATAGTGGIIFAGTSTSVATLAIEKAAQPAGGGTFSNVLANFGDDDVLDLKGLAFSNALGNGAFYDTNTRQLTVTENGVSENYTLENSKALAYFAQDDGHGGTLITDNAPCYCPGTLILTDRGEVPVEDLAIGDVVVTAAGALRPVKWIGRRSYDGRFIAGNRMALPIRFAAGSLGEGLPRRDLWVSPGHAMLVEDQLIHAYLLVNGVSVTQAEAVDSVTYLNVELGDHDVILAEGAPAESFYDNGIRNAFANAAEFHRLYPADPGPGLPCLPLLDQGFALEGIRQRIDARAGVKRPAPAAPGPLRGYVDVAGPTMVAGWAQDESHPEEPARLDVLVDGRRVMRILANKHRADLREAGLGSGRHSFELALPEGCRGVVTVRRTADGAELPLTGLAREALAA